MRTPLHGRIAGADSQMRLQTMVASQILRGDEQIALQPGVRRNVFACGLPVLKEDMHVGCRCTVMYDRM